MKNLNESGRQKLGRQKSCQQAQHAKLYFDQLQTQKKEPLIPLGEERGGLNFCIYDTPLQEFLMDFLPFTGQYHNHHHLPLFRISIDRQSRHIVFAYAQSTMKGPVRAKQAVLLPHVKKKRFIVSVFVCLFHCLTSS